MSVPSSIPFNSKALEDPAELEAWISKVAAANAAFHTSAAESHATSAKSLNESAAELSARAAALMEQGHSHAAEQAKHEKEAVYWNGLVDEVKAAIKAIPPKPVAAPAPAAVVPPAPFVAAVSPPSLPTAPAAVPTAGSSRAFFAASATVPPPVPAAATVPAAAASPAPPATAGVASPIPAAPVAVVAAEGGAGGVRAASAMFDKAGGARVPAGPPPYRGSVLPAATSPGATAVPTPAPAPAPVPAPALVPAPAPVPAPVAAPAAAPAAAAGGARPISSIASRASTFAGMGAMGRPAGGAVPPPAPAAAVATPAAVAAPAAVVTQPAAAAPAPAPAAEQEPDVPTGTGRFCRAVYNYPGNADNNIYAFAKHDQFEIYMDDGDWWLVKPVANAAIEPGFVPRNYVEVCPAPANAVPPPAPVPVPAPAPPREPTPPPREPTPPPAPVAPVELRVRGKYLFEGQGDDFLPFSAGDELIVTGDTAGQDWWVARHCITGKSGYIPSNFVEIIQ